MGAVDGNGEVELMEISEERINQMAAEAIRQVYADKIAKGEWFPLKAVLERLEKDDH